MDFTEAILQRNRQFLAIVSINHKIMFSCRSRGPIISIDVLSILPG